MERLRTADENTKTRWLVALSIMCMIIIVFVWLKYFNNLIAQQPRPQPIAETKNEPFSFWQTMKNGAEFLGQNIIDKLRNFGALLGAPRSYIVNPPK